jgi:glycosyltransferase involved in cell wall biosynthesis
MCQEPSAFIHSKRWIKALPWNAPGIAARIGNPILKAIDTHLAQNVDYVFGNSQFCRSLTLATYGYNPEIVGISYPGVDTKRFTYNPTVPKASNAFVTCARLSAFKNIDRIIKALATIPDPSVSLTVIGNGEQYESLVQLTNTLQLQSRVKFLQTISDVQMIHEFQSSLALIHAAEEEPFGLTPVEAMACGTPVIAIRGGGPAETVVDGETGYLCASADERELAAGMQWALSHAHQMLEISRACAQRAQSFSWEEAANGLEAAFATR